MESVLIDVQKPTLTIRKAALTGKDHEQLTFFRREQYLTSTEFDIANFDIFGMREGDAWIAELNNKIVATFQVDILSDLSILEERVGCCLKNYTTNLPSLYVSKVATDKSMRRTGMNTYFRLLAIKKALNAPNVKSVCGAVYENASRLSLLKKLGYRFSEVKIVNPQLPPKGKVFFINLRRDKFQQAITYLENNPKCLNNKYAIDLHSL